MKENTNNTNKKSERIKINYALIIIIVCIALGLSSLGVGYAILTKDNTIIPSSNSSEDNNQKADSKPQPDDSNDSNQKADSKPQPDDSNDSNQKGSNSQKDDTSSADEKKPIKNENFVVTSTATVSGGVCVVTGYCPKNTEKIIVSGEDVVSTEIIPFSGKDKKYFMGQVEFNASTDIEFKAVDKSNKTLGDFSVSEYYKLTTHNLMYTSEYSPVFGKNSRVHFYSALLSYSLPSSNFTQNMKNTAEYNIDNIVSVAKSVGAEPIFLIIPTSADIYPESVPTPFSKASGDRLFDEFKRIAESKGAKVIYPISTMKAHKNDGVGYQIFQHTDSHWSAYGAYWGTYDLFNYISEKFPNAKPRSLSEMGFYTTEMCGGDALFNLPNGEAFETDRSTGKVPNSKIKELTTLYSFKMPTSTLRDVYHSNTALYLGEDNAGAAMIHNSRGEGLPTAVIMRDSFGKVSYDMVNDRFSTVYWGQFDNYVMPYDMIDGLRPNYVIYMYSERSLMKIMLGNSNASILNLQ